MGCVVLLMGVEGCDWRERERERERERGEEEKKRACAAHLDFYLMQPFDQDGCSEKTNRG